MGRLTDALTLARTGALSAPDRDAGHTAEPRAYQDVHSVVETSEMSVEAPSAPLPRHPVHRLRLTSPAAQPLRPYLTSLVDRTFLAPARVGDAVRSVMFAGVDGVEESALLAAATAEILAARARGWICLVDANFRAPSLHRHYGIANTLGLADALIGSERASSYARQLAREHKSSLCLLPAGHSANGRERLLTTDADRRRMRDVITAFDYVVVVAAAFREDPTVLSLGTQVDGVVLVAEANVTKRRAVRWAADALRASGGRVLGTVLNNRTFPIPEALYRLL